MYRLILIPLKYLLYIAIIAVPILLFISGVFLTTLFILGKYTPEEPYVYFFIEYDLLISFTIHPVLWILFFVLVKKSSGLHSFLFTGIIIYAAAFLNSIYSNLTENGFIEAVPLTKPFHLSFFINMVLLTVITIKILKERELL